MCSFKKNVIEYVQISQLIMIYLKKYIFLITYFPFIKNNIIIM